ncbi:MAG: hypothetical protein RI924_757 [Bacteroidota bacterium]
MKLNLKRPLAFFDIESTGINVSSDRIVEISILKAMPDGTEQVKTLRVNPEMPIPLEASLVHGIYDEDIQHEPTFKQVGGELARFLDDCDLAGYNSNKFDIPMLVEEFLRAGIDFEVDHRHFVDVQNIFHQMEQRTLKAAYQFYCGKTLENAHSAEADIRATYEVLLAQVERYQNREWEDRRGNKSIPVQNDVPALHAFTSQNKWADLAGRLVYDDKGNEVFNFGKHKGRACVEVFKTEPSYYAWMMQGDFALTTKKKLSQIWDRWQQQKNAVGEQSKLDLGETKPAQPIDNDMLNQLQRKFGKE